MDQIKLLMSSIPVVDDTCLLHCVGWSLLFGFMHLSLPVYFNNFQHEWWSGLKEKKRKDIVAALCGMVHHATVVVIAFDLFHRFCTTGEVASSAALKLISPFVFGYLIGDTLFYVVFEAMEGRYEYLVHHIIGLWLVAGTLNATNPELLAFLPHILVTEMSTFLFGAGWVLRSTIWKTHPIIDQLELSFVLAFTVTRVINLPYQVWSCWPHMDELGSARYAFLGVLAIQFYWFHKMMLVVYNKYIVKEKPKGKDA